MELIEAVKTGNLNGVKEALQAGEDIHQQDKYGWMPLNWAAGRGNLELINVLLAHGADVFKVGRDLRTPQMIALAAGHIETVKRLREAESLVDPAARLKHPEREYCKAYHLRDLRQFPAWEEKSEAAKPSGNGASQAAAPLSDDSIVYVHHNYVVTKSIWCKEDIVFDRVSPEWKQFCESVLRFRVPDDLDLIVPAANSQAAAAQAVRR